MVSPSRVKDVCVLWIQILCKSGVIKNCFLHVLLVILVNRIIMIEYQMPPANVFHAPLPVFATHVFYICLKEMCFERFSFLRYSFSRSAYFILTKKHLWIWYLYYAKKLFLMRSPPHGLNSKTIKNKDPVFLWHRGDIPD